MIIFVVPCFNAERNLDKLASSLQSQSDDRWTCIMVDDMSEDDTWKKMIEICTNDSRFSCRKNSVKKFALRNIVETSRLFQDVADNVIIATIDGDDFLCNNDAVSIVNNEYSNGSDVVWTAHEWDINGSNISNDMPDNVDPYFWPWCSSHLRTFRCALLKKISDKNFKDEELKWFKRGYDQALMLPILSVSNKRKYIDTVCYRYNINSVSVNDRDWAEMRQISTINLVRARGFIAKKENQ